MTKSVIKNRTSVEITLILVEFFYVIQYSLLTNPYMEAKILAFSNDILSTKIISYYDVILSIGPSHTSVSQD